METDRTLRISGRIYGALLLAYPKEFREEYASHMAQAFGDVCREASAKSGRIGLARLWFRTLLDLAVTASAWRKESIVSLVSLIGFGRLVTALGGVLGLVGILLAVAQMLYPHLPLFAASSLLGFFGAALLAGGLIGLYALSRECSGRLAYAGVLLCSLSVCALVVLASTLVIQLANGSLDELLAQTEDSLRFVHFWSSNISYALGIVGLLVVGLAVYRARVLDE